MLDRHEGVSAGLTEADAAAVTRTVEAAVRDCMSRRAGEVIDLAAALRPVTAANPGEVVLEWAAGVKRRLGKKSLARSLCSGDDQEYSAVERPAGLVVDLIDGVADEVRAGWRDALARLPADAREPFAADLRVFVADQLARALYKAALATPAAP